MIANKLCRIDAKDALSLSVMETSYIDHTVLLTLIEPYKKVLIQAPRRSGKTLFLGGYRFIKTTKHLYYYAATSQLCETFKKNIEATPGITMIHVVDETRKRSRTFPSKSMLLLDDTQLMSEHHLRHLLSQDVSIVAIGTLNLPRDTALFAEYGFHTVVAPFIEQ